MGYTRRQFARLVGLAMASGLLACTGCRSVVETASSGYIETSFFCFDTLCTISGSMERRALDAACERCRWFDGIFSIGVNTSDVARINAAQGSSVQVEPETADLIAKSLGYSRESGGLFDITIGAVSMLWDFKEGVVPEPDSITAALPHVDYRNIEVDGTAVRVNDPEARIDLGGIAKGYIADDIVSFLQQRGVTSACVNLGGNVKVLGEKADGSPWRIGVQAPEAESDEVVATKDSTGGSLVTSGLYERCFERDGKRYWHILDPRTGYPAESEIVSASIYATASIDGEGYTKPLFMMGIDEALAFLRERPRLQGLLIGVDGSIAMTPGSDFTVLQ